jgi:hypothetical protein
LAVNDIVISKKNEVYAKITCEKHIAQELSEFFTFFVPGYQFVPAYRNRIWDGKIRLFNLQSFILYRGLLNYVEQFCEERNYTFEYEDGVDIEDEFSLFTIGVFINMVLFKYDSFIEFSLFKTFVCSFDSYGKKSDIEST